MKKVLTITAFALAAVTAFGQGAVTFSNSGNVAIRRDTTGAPVPTGSSFQVALFWAPDGTTDFRSAAMQVGGNVNFGPTAGFFSGGNRTITEIQPAGAFALFQVRVWETAYGNSYDSVLAGNDPAAEVGQSAVFRVDTANPLIGEPPTSLGTLIPVFSVSPVPEPSVIALGLLGAGALLMLRRRK